LLLAAFLHDVGMSAEANLSLTGLVIARPIMDRAAAGPAAKALNVASHQSIATECLGHMANRKIYSLERSLAGGVMECDMDKGRARIPMSISKARSPGYSQLTANSIEKW
jgi:metal-dependent HD superfamily phosphatase/phosphodiesterase